MPDGFMNNALVDAFVRIADALEKGNEEAKRNNDLYEKSIETSEKHYEMRVTEFERSDKRRKEDKENDKLTEEDKEYRKLARERLKREIELLKIREREATFTGILAEGDLDIKIKKITKEVLEKLKE